MREESETFVIWVWENKSAFWISLCISRIEPKPENSEQIEACECWREVLNYPREVFVLSTLDTVLPSERITVLPKLSNVSLQSFSTTTALLLFTYEYTK